MSVGKKLVKGAAWNALSKFGAQGSNFVVLLVLIRLLTPADFGLLSMAAVFIKFLGYFTELGLLPALIQAKEVDDDDCCTVFWSTLLFSGVVYALMFFLAPLIAAFYREPAITAIVRVLFAIFLFAPLGYIPEAKETRGLRYDRIATADLIGLGVSSALAIWLAVMGYGIWSLVAQQIAMTLTRSAALALLTQWRPRLFFSLKKFKALIRPGFHFTLKNLIFHLSTGIDSLLIGKILGPAALGLYSLSMRLASYAVIKVWTIAGEMLVPAFVSFRSQMDRVKKNYARVSIGTSFVLIPLLAGLFFGAEPLVGLVFGETWAGMVPVIRVLIIFYLVDSIFMPDESLLIAMDRVMTLNVIRLLSALALGAAGYALIRPFGLIGMAAAFTATSIAAGVVTKARLLKTLDVSWHRYWMDIKAALRLASAVAALLGLYWLLARQVLPPVIFLSGEAVIVGVFFVLTARKYELINLSEKKLNVDRLLSTSR